MKKGFFAGKTVLIMGLGRFGGGVDAAEFAVGAGAEVVVTDIASAESLADSVGQLEGLGGIEYHLGGHREEDFRRADIIVVNPAVAADNEFLQIAKEHDKFVTSQMNIFFELCGATIIGITGANGKSTTTALTAHLLKSGIGQEDFRYKNVWLGGNIGKRPLLGIVEQIGSDDLVVLELSSFQSEWLGQIEKAPAVSVLTNLTPNHLDRHGTFADYCSAKENIFRFQRTDSRRPAVSIFNADDEIGREWFEKYSGQQGRLCYQFCAEGVDSEIAERFALPGRANLSNLAAAITIAEYFGVDAERMKDCLSEFEQLPHRLEFVAQVNGVKWYNDSIATTPASAIVALEAFEEDKIIIAGGYDKNLDLAELGEVIARKAKAVVLIGQTAEKIAKCISCKAKDGEIVFAGSLAEAVNLAGQRAERGDVVLLSPGCASYDMFENFEQRGRQFVELVRQISG